MGLYPKFKATLKQLIRERSGATAIEYSLIAGLIFLAIAGSIRAFAESRDKVYEDISSAIEES